MTVTDWVILVAIALLIAYDFYAAWRWGEAGTISERILTGSKARPAIAFAAGFLCGHLFWPQAL